MIGTLDTFKETLKLGNDASRDAALTLLMDAATVKVLDRCRYSEADVEGQIDYFRKLKYNRTQRLNLRPVVAGSLVAKGRALGQTNEDWTPLTPDLLDDAEGVFMVLGAQSWWPPTQQIQPRFMRWRDPEWPIIQCTYNVTGIGSGEDAPEDIQAAVYALAGYWNDLMPAGAATAEQAGQLRRELERASFPAHVESMLARHLKGSFATWR